MTRVLPYGDRALLVEVDSLAAVLALYPALDAARVRGIGELVPSARTVLVTVDPARLSLGAAERWIRGVDAALPGPSSGAVSGSATSSTSGPLVTIPVRYTGEDLAEVAALTHTSVGDVIRRHTGTDWRVAFIGFSPGFAYLADAAADAPLDTRSIPRRTTSRPRVPAGAVGLAGEFTGIYPRESPGGWQLIGHTDVVLWDVNRPSPALLAPGTRVRFVDLDSVQGADALPGAAVLPDAAAGVTE